MTVNKTRGIIILLSFLSLVTALAFENKLIALILMAICMLAAVIILYRHLGELTDISSDNPKMKTLKLVTIFNIGIFVVCVIFAILLGTGIITFNDDGRYFAAAIISAVILFAGNVAPKLPFSKHTGLRLPWTVTNENAWIAAHRILGYISIPLAFIYIAGAAAISSFEVWTLIVIVLWIAIPGALSYIVYKKITSA